MDFRAYVFHMGTTKKIATNIPDDLLTEARLLTGLNQTQALIEGLRQLIAQHKRQRLLDLRGKLHIHLDRNRSRRRQRT